jgi:hypothetical protein
MATIAFLLAACLDPIQAALVLAIAGVYRGPLPILVAGTAAAAASEAVMALAANDYALGELLAPRLVAALLQAVAAVWAIRLLRGVAKGGLARPDVGPVSEASGDAATFAPLGAFAARSARRLSLTHALAFVRRRIDGLRHR